MDDDKQSQADAADQTGAVDAASQLTGALKGMTDQFSRLSRETKASQKKDRHMVIALVISVALDIMLSVMMIFLFTGQVHQNTTFRVAQQRQNTTLNTKLVKACQDINTNKANDIALWNYTLRNVHPKTAAQELSLQHEQQLVNVRDQQVDCVARYGVK